MKIAVLVRTRNESARIGPFCEAYSFADTIMVSDGGSDDDTVEIASRFPNVILRPYGERVQLSNNHWRNNDSQHVNHLIACAHALEDRPDWLILDDCDCRPNRLLRRDTRSILESTGQDFVMVVRIYLWGLGEHFPHMAKPWPDHHDRWAPSLFAWRESIDFWTVDVPPAFDFRVGDEAIADLSVQQKVLPLYPPYCILHFSWDDPDRVKRKVEAYRESAFIPGMAHPLDFAGPREPLPEWARE